MAAAPLAMPDPAPAGEMLAAAFHFLGVGGGVAGGVVEPAREHGVGTDRAGFLREEDEDRLGDVLCEMGVAHLPMGGGVDEIHVAGDQGGEGVLVAVVGVL